MYLDAYFDAVESNFRRIRETQLDVIKRVAAVTADSLAGGGAIHVMDTGHMLQHEAYYRAGGLMAVAPFSYELKVNNPHEQRPSGPVPSAGAGREARLVALALDHSKTRQGDVLFINSNSGRTANVIEVALQCRERGVITVGISSSEQMTRCDAAHPSGKKLFDVVDYSIDNCGPHGDAAVAVKNNEKICPLSGLSAAYIWWAIQAGIVERLQEKGINPTIFRSVHVSGMAYIEKQREEFLKKGL